VPRPWHLTVRQPGAQQAVSYGGGNDERREDARQRAVVQRPGHDCGHRDGSYRQHGTAAGASQARLRVLGSHGEDGETGMTAANDPPSSTAPVTVTLPVVEGAAR
jgi:hypothetical protein